MEKVNEIDMILTDLLRKQIKIKLQMDNPWWMTGKIFDDFSKMSRRLYFNVFYPLVTDLSIRRTIILMGPRRVGKSVMLYHTIEQLIKDGVKPQNIIYASIDTPLYSGIALEDLFSLALESIGNNYAGENYYVFFDEIQYLKNWEQHLKSLTDTYRNCRFVASGSAAAALKKKSDESGAGRFTDFMLPPLTFAEFVNLKGHQSMLNSQTINWQGVETQISHVDDLEAFNELFLEYINYGGYPEVAFSKTIQANPGQFIRHDIIDKVLLRDLPSLYGIQDVQELNTLFTVIAYRSGEEFSYENLSKESGVKKDTIKKYIEYLEAAFLIRVVHKVNENAKRFQRTTSFKIYLTNPSLRCALFQPLQSNDLELGNMVETTIFAQWIQRPSKQVYYANWKLGRNNNGEVDLVGINIATQKPQWAVEIKWTDRFYERPEELESLKTFMTNNHLDIALVTSKTKSGSKSFSAGNLLFVPSSLYAYEVGRNTFEQRKTDFGMW
jgi:predicted AAA+ superfamily ATPase